MTLKLIAIGGLGNMLGPSAQHLQNKKSAQYLRILDRGTYSAQKDSFRTDWQAHGAQLVPSLTELVGDGDFDGIVICVGKNGDDYLIIKALVPLLVPKKKPYFILHFSTVSCHFVQMTHQFCTKYQIQYANYPLTGGVKGAETGNMLILCSGDKSLFEKVEPMLSDIGTPKYFGEAIDLATSVKLIGHVLVFHGLLGVSLAVSLQKQVFAFASLNSAQATFFDFLNQGAGGSKQWDFTVRPGIIDDNWSQGFLIQHAVIDVIYTIELLLEQQLPRSLLLPLLEVVLLFGYLLQQHPMSNLSTQAITRLIAATPREAIDGFMEEHLSLNVQQCIQHCVAVLPETIQKSLMLQLSYN